MAEEQIPWTRPGFVAAAAMMGIIVVMAAVVVVLGQVSSDDEAETGAAHEEDASPEAAGDEPLEGFPEDSVCGLYGIDPDIPESTPETEWEVLGTVQAPSVEGEGPGEVEEDGFRHCYAPTPTGALLAAANMTAMSNDRSLQLRMHQELLAEGPGKQVALEQLEEEIALEAEEEFAPRVEIHGFNILVFEDNFARVDLAVSTSRGIYVSLVEELVWEEGDWRFTVTKNGGRPYPLTLLDDVGEYIHWAGDE